MMQQIVLTICENGRVMFEDMTPNSDRWWVLNDKEKQAPYYIRVHATNTIYHVISFILTRSQDRSNDDYTTARAAVTAYENATRIEVLDLNDKDPKWRTQ